MRRPGRRADADPRHPSRVRASSRIFVSRGSDSGLTEYACFSESRRSGAARITRRGRASAWSSLSHDGAAADVALARAAAVDPVARPRVLGEEREARLLERLPHRRDLLALLRQGHPDALVRQRHRAAHQKGQLGPAAQVPAQRRAHPPRAAGGGERDHPLRGRRGRLVHQPPVRGAHAAQGAGHHEAPAARPAARVLAEHGRGGGRRAKVGHGARARPRCARRCAARRSPRRATR